MAGWLAGWLGIKMDLVTSQLRGRLVPPYQTAGVRWLLDREMCVGVKGGVLADEMGLGKTVQVLCTILGNPSPAPTLIVVPKSLVRQWVQACKTFIGVDPLVLERRDTMPGRVTRAEVAAHRVVLTSYPAIGGPERSNVLLEVPFKRVVLDEAHAIKNCKARLHKNAVMIRAEIKWALTGTPITRRKADFVALMRFIGCPVESRDRLRELKRVYVLRRTLEDVAAMSERLRLPPIEMRLHAVPFATDEERRMYADLKEEGRLRLRAFQTVGSGDNTMGHIIEVITRLRQTCVNPQLVIDGRGETGTWDTPITKLRALTELVAAQPAGSKTLVFTHWTNEATGIAEALRGLPLEVVMLNGSMSGKARDAAVSAFTAGSADVLVSQIEAGGVGLNLQAATHVYINSLHWNASSELQAIGRAHRIGVEHKVIVTRLAISGTVDEYIYRTQRVKLDYAADVLEDRRILQNLMAHNKMTLNDMRNIFE